MPRLNRFDDIFFPVETHPIYASIMADKGRKTISIPDKKAIVNCKNDRVLGVVGRDYRLVTNEEALNMAYECCRTVFPETKPSEWSVESIDAPATGGHCFIDLRHNSTALDFTFVPAKDKPDAYGPYIRITNSYNGLRALAFDIGFFRKVCSNGLILPGSIIRFKFSHQRREIDQKIHFEIAKDKLAGINSRFLEYLENLKNCSVKKEQVQPLLMAVLSIHEPKNINYKEKERRDWVDLEKHIQEICHRYIKDFGENAYSVFNAVTEFASHPPNNRCIHRERHSFQKLAGAWLNDFSDVCTDSKFDLDEYVEKLQKGKNNNNFTKLDHLQNN